MGDGRVDLSRKNYDLENEKGSYDEKWLEQSKAKLLKQIDDEKRTICFMSRVQKQMKKLEIKGIYFL